MELWFKNAALLNGHTEENAIKEIIEKNAMTFGFIQILCVVWAVPIGKNYRNCPFRCKLLFGIAVKSKKYFYALS